MSWANTYKQVTAAVISMQFPRNDIYNATTGNLEHSRTMKRSKINYYLETIFKPPEKLTCTIPISGDENCSVSDIKACGGYVVIDFESVFQRISLLVKCKMCSGTVIFSRAQSVGLGFKLVVNCQNCGELDRVDSSKIIGPTSNDYEVNARNEEACQLLADSSSNIRPNPPNQPMLNPQAEMFNSPFTTSTPRPETRTSQQSGQMNFLNSQSYLPSNDNFWQNQIPFGRHESIVPHPYLSNWQTGPGSEMNTSGKSIVDSNDIDSEAEDEDDYDDEGSQPQNLSFQTGLNTAQYNDNSESGSGTSKRKRRKVMKKQRAEGQQLTSDTPLPNFSSYVLAELAKPAPKMSVVLPPCKAYIVSVTGDEYPTKKEYEIFSLKMVLAYPSLKDPDTDHGFERFKKSLSASFRARRSYEKNIKPVRMERKLSEIKQLYSASSLDVMPTVQVDLNNQTAYNQPPALNIKKSKSDEEWPASSDSDESDNANTSSDNDYARRKPRRVIKKVRAEGQTLTSETPLPDFSMDVLTELSKPAPRMSVVLPTCKAHIVAVTGDEYPTKKEYEIFSQKMIMTFPSLRDPGTERGFERFKKSLSASFRARRSYERNIKPVRMGRKSLGLEPMPSTDFSVHPSLQQSSLDDEIMRSADQELSNIDCEREPDKARCLIEKSFNFRRKAVAAAGFNESEFLQMYKHLSYCDMVLYEYSLIVGISLQDLRDNFDEGLLVLIKMFSHVLSVNSSVFASTNEDVRKVEVLVQLQEHFLNLKHNRLESRPNPLFVIKHEMAAFNDGDMCFRNTQIPCALVLLSEEGCISKLMITYKDSIVLQKPNATAFDACSCLLAYFFILNIKYPAVYLDNLKALERLLNKKLSFASLQTTISSPYSNYVKHYEATLKEIQQYL